MHGFARKEGRKGGKKRGGKNYFRVVLLNLRKTGKKRKASRGKKRREKRDKEMKRKAEKVVLNVQEGDLPMLLEYLRCASALW